MVCDRFGVSERWACRVVGQHRSTQRYEPTCAEDDAALRARLREISAERPRWGYRRAHHRLREEGWEVNRKRVQRLWREEGLRVPVRRRKRRRLGESTVPAQRLRAERPNHVWALDFQHDQTADGRVIRLLNVVDEFTREALEMLVERSIDADKTVATLERLVAERGAPVHLRMDNGSELTAHALQDWCRFSKTGTAYRECRRNRVSVAERTSHAYENSQQDRSRRCCQRGAKRPWICRAERGVCGVAGRSRTR